jgi:hypothetical protein
MRSVIYFGLTLYKSFLLRQRQSSEMSARGGPASLVGTFVRDEAAVFLVLSGEPARQQPCNARLLTHVSDSAADRADRYHAGAQLPGTDDRAAR